MAAFNPFKPAGGLTQNRTSGSSSGSSGGSNYSSQQIVGYSGPNASYTADSPEGQRLYQQGLATPIYASPSGVGGVVRTSSGYVPVEQFYASGGVSGGAPAQQTPSGQPIDTSKITDEQFQKIQAINNPQQRVAPAVQGGTTRVIQQTNASIRAQTVGDIVSTPKPTQPKTFNFDVRATTKQASVSQTYKSDWQMQREYLNEMDEAASAATKLKYFGTGFPKTTKRLQGVGVPDTKSLYQKPQDIRQLFGVPKEKETGFAEAFPKAIAGDIKSGLRMGAPYGAGVSFLSGVGAGLSGVAGAGLHYPLEAVAGTAKRAGVDVLYIGAPAKQKDIMPLTRLSSTMGITGLTPKGQTSFSIRNASIAALWGAAAADFVKPAIAKTPAKVKATTRVYADADTVIWGKTPITDVEGVAFTTYPNTRRGFIDSMLGNFHLKHKENQINIMSEFKETVSPAKAKAPTVSGGVPDIWKATAKDLTGIPNVFTKGKKVSMGFGETITRTTAKPLIETTLPFKPAASAKELGQMLGETLYSGAKKATEKGFSADIELSNTILYKGSPKEFGGLNVIAGERQSVSVDNAMAARIDSHYLTLLREQNKVLQSHTRLAGKTTSAGLDVDVKGIVRGTVRKGKKEPLEEFVFKNITPTQKKLAGGQIALPAPTAKQKTGFDIFPTDSQLAEHYAAMQSQIIEAATRGTQKQFQKASGAQKTGTAFVAPSSSYATEPTSLKHKENLMGGKRKGRTVFYDEAEVYYPSSFAPDITVLLKHKENHITPSAGNTLTYSLPKTGAAPRSGLMQGELTFTGTAQPSSILNLPSEKHLEKQLQKEAEKVLSPSRTAGAEIVLPKQKNALLARLLPRTAAKTALKTAEQQYLEEKIKIKTPKPKTPFVFPWPSFPQQKNAMKKSFDVEVKRYGKWLKQAEALTESDAKALGAKITGATAARSFRLTPSTQQAKQAKGFGFFPFWQFRPAKKDKGVFVERTAYAINTPTEVQQISALGWQARRGNKNSFFKWF